MKSSRAKEKILDINIKRSQSWAIDFLSIAAEKVFPFSCGITTDPTYINLMTDHSHSEKRDIEKSQDFRLLDIDVNEFIKIKNIMARTMAMQCWTPIGRIEKENSPAGAGMVHLCVFDDKSALIAIHVDKDAGTQYNGKIVLHPDPMVLNGFEDPQTGEVGAVSFSENPEDPTGPSNIGLLFSQKSSKTSGFGENTQNMLLWNDVRNNDHPWIKAVISNAMDLTTEIRKIRPWTPSNRTMTSKKGGKYNRTLCEKSMEDIDTTWSRHFPIVCATSTQLIEARNRALGITMALLDLPAGGVILNEGPMGEELSKLPLIANAYGESIHINSMDPFSTRTLYSYSTFGICMKKRNWEFERKFSQALLLGIGSASFSFFPEAHVSWRRDYGTRGSSPSKRVPILMNIVKPSDSAHSLIAAAASLSETQRGLSPRISFDGKRADIVWV